MNRYFLEVAYKGTRYSGSQVQENAITIQSEIEKALGVYFRRTFQLSGSSRTDAGVHAHQNFFHFDSEELVAEKALYNINSILPDDIVIRSLILMKPKTDGTPAHARFDATSRRYKYYIKQMKDPFTKDTAFYYPYTVEIDRLEQAAAMLKEITDFTTFSKKNTQVKSFNCSIEKSDWSKENGCLVYDVKANRFLRGMVRALVGTMLHVGRNKITIEEFRSIIEAKDSSLADFSAPAHGLFLIAVDYPENFFDVK
jgi:tRNA pseudouridine38-40 synthase